MCVFVCVLMCVYEFVLLCVFVHAERLRATQLNRKTGQTCSLLRQALSRLISSPSVGGKVSASGLRSRTNASRTCGCGCV